MHIERIDCLEGVGGGGGREGVIAHFVLVVGRGGWIKGTD